MNETKLKTVRQNLAQVCHTKFRSNRSHSLGVITYGPMGRLSTAIIIASWFCFKMHVKS